MDHVVMYTDGACKGNPGPGGWGVWLRCGSNELDLFDGEADTTNNRMELLAVIRGLEALTRPCTVEVYLDSTYVRKGITEWQGNHRVDHGLEGQGMGHVQQETGQERRLVEATRRPGPRRHPQHHVALGQGALRGSGQRSCRPQCEQGS